MTSRDHRRHRYFPLFLISALLLAACAGPSAAPGAAPNEQRLGVAVSVAPQRYFVERLGGEHVRVSIMVGPGDSPHTYEPKPAQLKELSRATVYFTTGVEFEDVWMTRIASTNPMMRVVDTLADIEQLPLEDDHGDQDDHGDGLDPHVWTSPRLAGQQARLIAATLTELDPAHASDYATNLAALEADIAQLDTDLRATLGGVAGTKFMVFHPAWGYFARDYGLEQIAVEVGGQEPSAQELATLIALARTEDIRVIFVQPEFSVNDAETIAREIGGQIALVSPLAEDWLANMRAVGEAFAMSLR